MLEQIGAVLTKNFVEIVGRKIEKELINSNSIEIESPIFIKDLMTNVGSHLKFVSNWSSNIPFIGLSQPLDTDKNTIELSISSNLSKWGSEKETKSEISERELIHSRKNILIVGNPGSGKTTSLKRICYRILNDKSETNVPYPIVIRFRDLSSESIAKNLLDILGIKYADEIVEYEQEYNIGQKNYYTKTIKRTITKVGEVEIINFVSNLLNKLNALVFLDGLDEAPQPIKIDLLNEIEQIAMRLEKSRIVLTTRRGEKVEIINGFDSYEIKPLDSKKTQKICEKWKIKYSDFKKEISDKPFKDLIDRPIFLSLLLILYKRLGVLPSQPHEIYRESTFLIIKDWDDQRRIRRRSIYEEFNARKKLKFLQELSFQLTYKIKKRVFSRNDLALAYREIHSKYMLPEDQMDIVISEIESHNGIINEGGITDGMEFSHLSIQEYLCAEYLVTLPFSQYVANYFKEYVPPLGIAVCLSGNPGDYLLNLLFNKDSGITRFSDNSWYESSVFKLFNRILIESPNFNKSEALGISVGYLLTEFYSSNDQFKRLINEILELNNVKESLTVYYSKFRMDSIYNDFAFIKREKPSSHLLLISEPKIVKYYYEISKILKEIEGLHYEGIK